MRSTSAHSRSDQSLARSTAEGGTPWNAVGSLNVIAASSSSGLNTGGLPGVPADSPSDAGPALQSLLTLNITTVTELDLLLAALFDSSTGGVNGTFLPIAYQVPPLGINPVVTNALANATQSSGGLFGIPWGVVPKQPAPSSPVWGWIVNTVSGITTVAGKLLSVIWTLALAITTFISNHLPTWLKNLGENLIHRYVTALVAVGNALKQAIASFTSLLTQVITNLLTPAFAPVKALFTAYRSAVEWAFKVANSTVA